MQDTAYTNVVWSFGLLTTVAGAGGATFSPDNKWLPEFEGGPATNALLSRPHITMADRAGNLYIADKEAFAIRKVTPDGKFYILDRDNGLIRKVDTNRIMTLVVDHGGPIPEGRGLWVSSDESILYYSAGTQVMRWDRTNGLNMFANGFVQLGNLAVGPLDRLPGCPIEQSRWQTC